MKRCLLVIMMALVFLPSTGLAQNTKAKKFKAFAQKGYLASRNSDWKGCVTSYQQALRFVRSAVAYYSAARCLEKAGDLKLARDYYQRALNAKVDVLNDNLKAKTQKNIDRLDRALEAQEKLKTALSIAKNAYVKGQFDVALKHYQEAYNYQKAATYLVDAARSAQKMRRYEYALNLVDQALLETQNPLDEAGKKQALTLKRQLIAQLDMEKKAKEEAQWTTQRIDWKTYTGATTGVIGGALLGVALGVFGPRVREGYDNMNVHDREIYDQQAKEFNRTKSQGQFLFWTGVAFTAIGSGLVVWDVMTVERVKKPSADALVIFGGNQASFVVRF